MHYIPTMITRNVIFHRNLHVLSTFESGVFQPKVIFVLGKRSRTSRTMSSERIRHHQRLTGTTFQSYRSQVSDFLFHLRAAIICISVFESIFGEKKNRRSDPNLFVLRIRIFCSLNCYEFRSVLESRNLVHNAKGWIGDRVEGWKKTKWKRKLWVVCDEKMTNWKRWDVLSKSRFRE